MPIDAAGRRTAKMIPGAKLHEVKDGPHNVAWTHAEEVNTALVEFLGESAAKKASASQK